MTGITAAKEGKIVYDYIKSVVKDVTGAKSVAEYTVFNKKECKEIEKRLLQGPLNCSFVKDNSCDCGVMSLKDFLSNVRFQVPLPENLPQYR